MSILWVICWGAFEFRRSSAFTSKYDRWETTSSCKCGDNSHRPAFRQREPQAGVCSCGEEEWRGRGYVFPGIGVLVESSTQGSKSVYPPIEPGMNFFDRKGIRIKKNVFLIGC